MIVNHFIELKIIQTTFDNISSNITNYINVCAVKNTGYLVSDSK